jgi:ribonuclease G
MSKELIVAAGRHETKVAILEDDQLVEIFHEREKEYSLAGSIHKGRVTRVLPGMQSAFVDIGLERDAFLYVSDFFEDNEEYDAVVSTVEEKVLKMEKGGGVVEPVRALVAEPAPEADEAVAAPPAPVTEPRPERGEQRGERGGDRGGDGGDRRGRRGRRRRGGRGPGGLPESKFFSPRNETQKESDTETEESEAEPEVRTEIRAASVAEDDFMVLPGESLAKYSEPEPRRERQEEDAEEEFAEEAAAEEELAELQAEPAGETMAEAPAVPAAATPSVTEQPEREFPAAVRHEPAPVDSAGPQVGHAAVETLTPETLTPQPLTPAPLTPEPEASYATEEDEEAGEAEFEEESDIAEVAQNEAEAALAEGLPVEQISADAVPAEEGPEPARIPTSLTATLREQGHRYPHRVSRRMRRKMRGGQAEDREQKGGTPGAVDGSPAAPAVRTVEPRVERPAERTGEPREERRPERPERSGRDRADRSADRGERNEQRSERERPERDRTPLPSIADLLKEGQEIIVQIAKEPLGQKGARITSHIALPGRFVVYMPTVDHAGVSRKIPSEEERQRLKRVLQTHRQGIPGGFICRTAAENKSEEELKNDMHFLYNLWLDMRQKAERKPAPVLLHHDLDLVQRILRDQLTSSFKAIWVDSEDYYESILRFVQRFQPALVGRVKLYTRPNPIFDEFGITQELEKALRPKVWLKSGGYIVINQTEALVAIDINTGKYVGKSNRLEDTIVKINTDAIREIVRQIRVRDLGGIIVVDFIDMDERKNRQKVMQALEESMRADRAPYKILQFNDFGLVAITRKRVKQSLERTLCSPCPYCEGAGYVKSVQTVIGEILQEAQRMRRTLEDQNNNIVLRVNPEVARVLKSNQNQFLQELEETMGKSVLIKSDPLLHQVKFDLA